MTLYRRELCNLNNSVEGDILLRIAGLSLVPGPPIIKKISDETQEGRDEIAKLIKEGYQVIFIKD